MIENEKQVHKTVLLKEAVNVLNIKEGDVIVDATLGAGGHTLEILKKIGGEGQVISFDVDKKAIEEFIVENRFTIKEETGEIYIINEKPLILINDNFVNIKTIIAKLYARGSIKSKQVDGILADLGWRIEQVQDSRYGMSFTKDAPLKMRFDGQDEGLTAYKIINEWSEEELKDIFKELGEESFAGQIAREIVFQREKQPIKTTVQLADIASSVKRNLHNSKIHPATKIFQALRIATNKELSVLQGFLKDSLDVLRSKKRLAIISFHSLEDRLVKKIFRTNARGCICPKESPICTCQQERSVRVLFGNGLISKKDEIVKNPRARSARLRVVEKI